MLSRDPSFHCKWELFHPHWIGALNEDELAALAARANSVEAIANWRARQPGAVIDLLLGLNPWYRNPTRLVHLLMTTIRCRVVIEGRRTFTDTFTT
jgi:hypothetical protein